METHRTHTLMHSKAEAGEDKELWPLARFQVLQD